MERSISWRRSYLKSISDDGIFIVRSLPLMTNQKWRRRTFPTNELGYSRVTQTPGMYCGIPTKSL